MGKYPCFRLEWHESNNRFVELNPELQGDFSGSVWDNLLKDPAVMTSIQAIKNKLESSSGIKRTQSRIIWIWVNILIVVFGYAAGFLMMIRKQYVWAVVFLACAPMISFVIIIYRSLVKDRWDSVNNWLDSNQGWLIEVSKSIGLRVSWFFTKEGRHLFHSEPTYLRADSLGRKAPRQCFSGKPGVFGYVVFSAISESRVPTIGSRRSVEKDLVTATMMQNGKSGPSSDNKPKFIKSNFESRKLAVSNHEVSKIITTKLPVNKPGNSPPNNPLKPKPLILSGIYTESANRLLPNSSNRQILPDPSGLDTNQGESRKKTQSIRSTINTGNNQSSRRSILVENIQQNTETLKPSVHKTQNLKIPSKQALTKQDPSKLGDEKPVSIQQEESWDGSQALEDESMEQSRVAGIREQDANSHKAKRETFILADMKERNGSIDNFVHFFGDKSYQAAPGGPDPVESAGKGSTKDTSNLRAKLSKGSFTNNSVVSPEESSFPKPQNPQVIRVKAGGDQKVPARSGPQLNDNTSRRLANANKPLPEISITGVSGRPASRSWSQHGKALITTLNS